MTDPQPETPEPVPGLTNPRTLSLERSPIRVRESSSTRSAWRLAVESGEGAGSITLVDTASGAEIYRGDGVFLGWPQERLAAAYEALRPKPERETFETQQLG
jgi:hypothetical protein